MRRLAPLTLLPLAFAVSACGDDSDSNSDTGTIPDTGSVTPDTGTIPDTGTPVDMGEADTGTPVDMGEADMGEADTGTPVDMGEADMGMAGPDAGSAMTTDMQIAAVRTAAEGASGTDLNPALPIRGAFVTYVLPSGVADAGYFLQRSPTGPAVFVNTGTVAPMVMVGDAVNLDVNQVNDNNDFLEVTGTANLMVIGSGFDVMSLIQDISAATDIVSSVRDYESERIVITGTLSGGSGFAGSGYVAFPMDTAGVMGDADLRFRVADAVNAALSPSQGCALTASGAMWRFRADAQPQVWALGDISGVSCPLSAAAGSPTTVIVRFGRNLDATSVMANGSQFTIPGLTVSQAAVTGAEVTLTTTMQRMDTSYTVTVANTVLDVTGSANAAPSDTASFTGFAPPASVVINEVLYDGTGSTDAQVAFTELFGPPGTNLSGWTLVGFNGSNDSEYRTIMLTGTIPADGFYVLATSSATGGALAARDQTDNVDWQNGADAVQLRDPTGMTADALQYGTTGTFMRGEGTPSPDVSAGSSLSRDAAHTDTDDNATDFTTLTTPTPGS